MGKISVDYRHERLKLLFYESWEIYRRGNFYLNGFKKFERDKKNLKKLGKADFNHPEYKNLIHKFQKKYYIPPINPKLRFDEVDKVYEYFLLLGYKEPNPLEALFYKGKKNIPIWEDTTLNSKIFIPKPLLYSVSLYLTQLDSMLGIRNVRAKGTRIVFKPFIDHPDIYSNGIFLNLNLKATKKTIIQAVKNILLEQGAKECDTRKRDFRRFLIMMNIFDLKKENPDLSFGKFAENFVSVGGRMFYPKKSIPEIAKILSDDYNDVVRLINPGKKKFQKKKDFSLIGHKDFNLSYIGLDYAKLEIIRSRKKPKIDDNPKSKLEIKREDIDLFNEKEFKKISPAKIFTLKKYSQNFLKKLIPS